MYYARPILDYRTPPQLLGYPAPARPASNIASVAGAAMLLLVTGAVYGLSQSPEVTGVLYAIGFLALTWSRPGVALALIIASTPFQYDVSAGGPMRFSMAEINLALSVPAWLFGPRGPRRAKAYALWLAVGGYFFIAIVASAMHWRGSSAVASLLQMALYMIAAVGVFTTLGRRPEYYVQAMIAFLGVCVAFAILTPFMRGGHMYGLHKNGVGASLAAGVVVGVELWFSRGFHYSRKFVAVATLLAAAGLTLSLSRGSWLAAGTGILFTLALRGRFRLLLQVSLALIPAIVLAWALLPAESKEYALNFTTTGDSIKARYKNIEFARQQFESSPVVGVGVGLRKEFDATNIFWVTLAETGVFGVGAFFGIQAVVVWMVVKLRRVVGPTDPRFTFVVLAGGLILGRLAHGMFDHYWSRGALMVAWASVGMLVRVYGEAFVTRAARR